MGLVAVIVDEIFITVPSGSIGQVTAKLFHGTPKPARCVISHAAASLRGISLRRTCATGFSCNSSSVACTRRSA